jgi:uncharacterized protein YprB with RNaseH-like and TPR domain
MRIENSFIPARGVGEKTERRLWREGVVHWDDFEEGLVGEKTGRNVSAFIENAYSHLDAGEADFFGRSLEHRHLWRIYDNFRENACYFDIETTGLSRHWHDVTTVSVHRDGETRTYVRGEDLTSENLRREFEAASLLVSFNGRGFDAPFLETNFDVDLARPHLDLRFLCQQVDMTGGLGAVEQICGIERDRPDIGGEDAVRLWREYERGDDEALETLVAYNQEDARNLETVMETVHERLVESVFRPHCPEQ